MIRAVGVSGETLVGRLSKKIVWSYDKYRAALLGDEDAGVEGLRTLAIGFSPADGYNLHDFDNWTRYQKEKIKKVFGYVRALEEQPKKIIRSRSKENLKVLQDSFHGDVPSKLLKVAFVPYHTPVLSKSNKKQKEPRITLFKGGVSIKTPYYKRTLVKFDPVALATDAAREIKRVIAEMPDAQQFTIQNGRQQMLGTRSARVITQTVLNLMMRYDGVKPIPHRSGNYGDKPELHHWSVWMTGLVGYELTNKTDAAKLGKLIEAGRAKNKDRRRKEKNLLIRKTRKRGKR